MTCRLEPSAAALRRSEAAPLVTARVQSMRFPSSVLMEPPPVNHRLIASQIRCPCFPQMPAQCLVHVVSTCHVSYPLAFELVGHMTSSITIIECSKSLTSIQPTSCSCFLFLSSRCVPIDKTNASCDSDLMQCSAAQIAPPVQAQTPMPAARTAFASSMPTPVPSAAPLPVGGPLTPLPVLVEPRNDDEVAEQWSRGMCMLHDDNLNQVCRASSLTKLLHRMPTVVSSIDHDCTRRESPHVRWLVVGQQCVVPISDHCSHIYCSQPVHCCKVICGQAYLISHLVWFVVS